MFSKVGGIYSRALKRLLLLLARFAYSFREISWSKWSKLDSAWPRRVCSFNVCQSRAKKDMRYESERGALSYESESTRLDSKWWQTLLLSTRGYTKFEVFPVGTTKKAQSSPENKAKINSRPQLSTVDCTWIMISCCDLSEKKLKN